MRFCLIAMTMLCATVAWGSTIPHADQTTDHIIFITQGEGTLTEEIPGADFDERGHFDLGATSTAQGTVDLVVQIQADDDGSTNGANVNLYTPGHPNYAHAWFERCYMEFSIAYDPKWVEFEGTVLGLDRAGPYTDVESTSAITITNNVGGTTNCPDCTSRLKFAVTDDDHLDFATDIKVAHETTCSSTNSSAVCTGPGEEEYAFKFNTKSLPAEDTTVMFDIQNYRLQLYSGTGGTCTMGNWHLSTPSDPVNSTVSVDGPTNETYQNPGDVWGTGNDDPCLYYADPNDTIDNVDTDKHCFKGRRVSKDCDADFNNDGVVGIPDFGHFKASQGLGQGDPGWDPETDYNDDLVTGIPDFGRFKALYAVGSVENLGGVECTCPGGADSCILP